MESWKESGDDRGENAIIGLDTANVRKFYNWGARYMSLAHNGHSQFSVLKGEYSDPYIHDGIFELGKQVIDRTNYYGMMVDISHLKNPFAKL